MTPKSRIIAALERRTPDDIVPTFELSYQLTEEKFGRPDAVEGFAYGNPGGHTLEESCELSIMISEEYDYSILRVTCPEMAEIFRRQGLDSRYLITCIVGATDGTMRFPKGDTMIDRVIRMKERPDEEHAVWKESIARAKEFNRRMADAGAECVVMCADYCFNSGPFLSPLMFAEFVAPYLAEQIADARDAGLYVIKHTDGDMMPILDQLVDANPHALHSVDPQAGVDLAEVKRLVGDRVALCGNVNCGLLQTGTDEEVEADVLRSLRDGMPGGGYVFCTSNCVFKGMPLERYEMMMELRRRHGRYDGSR